MDHPHHAPRTAETRKNVTLKGFTLPMAYYPHPQLQPACAIILSPYFCKRKGKKDRRVRVQPGTVYSSPSARPSVFIVPLPRVNREKERERTKASPRRRCASHDRSSSSLSHSLFHCSVLRSASVHGGANLPRH